jgi:hypothetical protein
MLGVRFYPRRIRALGARLLLRLVKRRVLLNGRSIFWEREALRTIAKIALKPPGRAVDAECRPTSRIVERGAVTVQSGAERGVQALTAGKDSAAGAQGGVRGRIKSLALKRTLLCLQLLINAGILVLLLMGKVTLSPLTRVKV